MVKPIMHDKATLFLWGFLLLLFLSVTDNFTVFAMCGLVSKTYPFTSLGSFMSFGFSLFSFSGVNGLCLSPGTEQLLYP